MTKNPNQKNYSFRWMCHRLLRFSKVYLNFDHFVRPKLSYQDLYSISAQEYSAQDTFKRAFFGSFLDLDIISPHLLWEWPRYSSKSLFKKKKKNHTVLLMAWGWENVDIFSIFAWIISLTEHRVNLSLIFSQTKNASIISGFSEMLNTQFVFVRSNYCLSQRILTHFLLFLCGQIQLEKSHIGIA